MARKDLFNDTLQAQMLKRHFGTNLEPFQAQNGQVIKIIHFGTRLKSFLGQAAQTGVDQKQSEGLVKRLAIPNDMHLTKPSEDFSF